MKSAESNPFQKSYFGRTMIMIVVCVITRCACDDLITKGCQEDEEEQEKKVVPWPAAQAKEKCSFQDEEKKDV